MVGEEGTGERASHLAEWGWANDNAEAILSGAMAEPEPEYSDDEDFVAAERGPKGGASMPSLGKKAGNSSNSNSNSNSKGKGGSKSKGGLSLPSI